MSGKQKVREGGTEDSQTSGNELKWSRIDRRRKEGCQIAHGKICTSSLSP